MAEAQIPIRHTDPTQESESLQRVAADVAKILTPNEEILYIALQNVVALSVKKDSVVATTNRVILYRPSILGRTSFQDFLWQDVASVHIRQGILSTEFHLEATDGRSETLSDLHKDQAQRLYAVCQQMDQEWREKRRIREMEQDRAKAGGVYMEMPTGTSTGPQAAEDPVAKLAKAKEMLTQGLISEIEFESVKAKILSSM